MDHHRSLGDRAVAIATVLALVFAAAFAAEPARESNPPPLARSAAH
jgi:hypothetical protein